MKFNTEQFFDHIHLFIISLIFGIGSFLYKVQQGKAPLTKFSAMSEVSFSLISAYLAFRLCSYFNAPEDLLWAFVGIASWSGTRFLIKMEELLEKYIDKKLELETKAKEEQVLATNEKE